MLGYLSNVMPNSSTNRHKWQFEFPRETSRIRCLPQSNECSPHRRSQRDEWSLWGCCKSSQCGSCLRSLEVVYQACMALKSILPSSLLLLSSVSSWESLNIFLRLTSGDHLWEWSRLFSEAWALQMAQEEVSAAGLSRQRVCQSGGTSTDRTRASKRENKEHLAHAVCLPAVFSRLWGGGKREWVCEGYRGLIFCR